MQLRLRKNDLGIIVRKHYNQIISKYLWSIYIRDEIIVRTYGRSIITNILFLAMGVIWIFYKCLRVMNIAYVRRARIKNKCPQHI